MSSIHYVVFVGASPALVDALAPVGKRISGVRFIAPPARKHVRGVTVDAIEAALSALTEQLRKYDNPNEAARLSVWAYEGSEQEAGLLAKAFGKSAWVEFLPARLVDKMQPTREHLETRLLAVAPLLHEISHHVFRRRRSSPMPIPHTNFRSKVLNVIAPLWYRGLDLAALRRWLEAVSSRFRQTHTKSEPFAHHDDRGLIFAPAPNEICHGLPHPVGDNNKCFIEGRFRFGTALYPGFHYDVQSASGTIAATLLDCDGDARDMRPEKRRYINIFPNEHLLPKRA